MKKVLLLALGMQSVFASSGQEGCTTKASQGDVPLVSVYEIYDPEDGEIMKISIFGYPATADNVLMCVKGCKGDWAGTLMALSLSGQKILGNEVLRCGLRYSLVIGAAVLGLGDRAG